MNSTAKKPINALADETIPDQPTPTHLLWQLLGVTAVAWGLATLLFAIRGDMNGSNLAISGGVLLALLVNAGLLHSGWLKLAAHIYAAALWVSATAVLLVYEIYRIPSVGVYVILVLAIALLLRGRVTIFYALLSFAVAAAIVLADEQGLIPLFQPNPYYLPSLSNTYAKSLIALVLLGLAYIVLRHTLATLRFNESNLQQIRETLGQRTADLSATNQQLRHEISERQQTTEALREKEEQFRTLVEASFDGIIICQNHIILEANASFAAMFGFSSVAEVTGKSANFFLTPESSRPLMELSQTNERISTEATGVRADKSTFPVEVISRTINYHGEPAQISGYRDITARKAAEAARQQAQKLEGLTTMAGRLAHDFNNLLVAMMGQISIAMAKLDEEHAGHAHLDKAIQATETAAWLTRQLLAYTGLGHFEVESIDLNELIGQNMSRIAEILPENIALITNLDPLLPQIQADGSQIQQCILNILDNAAEAIGDRSGTITLSTSPLALSAGQIGDWQPANDSLAPGDFVLLEIADTGRGIAQTTLSQIFEPFFTTKDSGQGLGLAAVLGIVRGHKGSLRVDSQAGQGTTFRLLFPSDRIEPAEPKTAVEPSPARQKAVLVIDDEKQVREAITDILDLEKIDVLTAANGEEGIAVFSANQAQIGLVILDLSMPGISGIEAFSALREIDPTAKIVLSSGFTEAEVLRKMAGTRPTGFLQKPYRLDSVLHTVEKYL